MSKNIEFNAEVRERVGKGGARATRRDGLVPAVIYGDKKAPVMISLEQKDVLKALHSGSLFTHICELKIGNDSHKVLARDVQLHPVKDMPMHVDFLRVTDRTMIAVEVPVHFENEETSKGLKAGGVLNTVRRTIEVNCRANAIPEELVFDLADCEIGDSIKISDFNLPDGVEPTITDRDFTIATLSAPRVAATTESSDEEESTEDSGDDNASEEGNSEASE